MSNGELAGQRDPKVGLCSICNRASTLVGAKGVTFWRCGESDSDAAFRRYPTLPVEDCARFEPGSPKTGNLAAESGRDPGTGSCDDTKALAEGQRAVRSAAPV